MYEKDSRAGSPFRCGSIAKELGSSAANPGIPGKSRSCSNFGEGFTHCLLERKKIYHLCTCSTCQRILKDIRAEKTGFELREIRSQPLTPSELDELKRLSGSYGSLFNRRAIKFRTLGLKDKKLSEKDYRRLILQEDTFLKRPVALIGNQIFIGSEKKNLEALKKALTLPHT